MNTPSNDNFNPFEVLISQCSNDLKLIQSRYTDHRISRNKSQHDVLLSEDFPGVEVDLTLRSLMVDPNFVDTRYGFVFSAKPPMLLKNLILKLQQELQIVAPHLWVSPPDYLHMTILEVTHTQTQEVVENIMNILRYAIPELTDYTHVHRSRLVKPMLSYDATAVALSFVPAAGEALPDDSNRTVEDDVYTYNHLRANMYDLSVKAGFRPISRYVVPTAHLTIARFVTNSDFETSGKHDPTKMRHWTDKIGEINAWLEKDYWPEGEKYKEGGEWILGQEKGLDCRWKSVYYGGGDLVREGKGF